MLPHHCYGMLPQHCLNGASAFLWHVASAFLWHVASAFLWHVASAFTCTPGTATTTVSQQLKEARVGEHLAVASERGKEYGVKGWGLLKSAYANVASQVENVARDNGYRVDLGEHRLETRT